MTYKITIDPPLWEKKLEFGIASFHAAGPGLQSLREFELHGAGGPADADEMDSYGNIILNGDIIEI